MSVRCKKPNCDVRLRTMDEKREHDRTHPQPTLVERLRILKRDKEAIGSLAVAELLGEAADRIDEAKALVEKFVDARWDDIGPYSEAEAFLASLKGPMP